MGEAHNEIDIRPPQIDQGVIPRILLFFDYACPFCYVDGFRFDQLARERTVEIIDVPLELRPDLPEEGVSALRSGLGHSERVNEHLRRLAREGGFPLVVPDHVPNSHRALVLGELARDAGEQRHAAMHAAIFNAYFGRGEDIGERDVLLRLATEQGFAPAEVEESWDDGVYEQRLRHFRDLAAQLGVASTPSALVCNELLIGSRPYQLLQKSVDRCLVTPESLQASSAGHAQNTEEVAPGDLDASR